MSFRREALWGRMSLFYSYHMGVIKLPVWEGSNNEYGSSFTMLSWLLWPARWEGCINRSAISHTIHVWYIYLHLPYKSTKCRQIYHTWILWVLGGLVALMFFLSWVVTRAEGPSVCVCGCGCGCVLPYGGFLKCWYPTTMGFPTKKDHFGVFGVPPF